MVTKSFFDNYFFNLNEFSMLAMSASNSLSTFKRFSTVEQLCTTVEWSRLPMSCPILDAGILVYFEAKYIDTWRAIT